MVKNHKHNGISAKRFAGLALLALLLSACSSREENEMEAKQEELEATKTELSSTESTCFSAEIARNRAEGKMALAEFDMVAVENVDHMSKDQEWAIRKSIGAEIGLAPSEVNGWKDMYRGRAEAAKRAQESIKYKIEEAAKEAKSHCDWRDDRRKRVTELETEILRLNEVIRKQ